MSGGEVVLVFHEDDGAWWAETDAVPTLTAVGADYPEVRRLAEAALLDLLGSDIDIRDDLSRTPLGRPVRLSRQGNPLGIRITGASTDPLGTTTTGVATIVRDRAR